MEELVNLLPAFIAGGILCFLFCLLEIGFMILQRISPRFREWTEKKSEECPALADDWEDE